MDNLILKECVVIGAGITGLAAARWLKRYQIDFVVLEKSDDIGGLWRYRDDDYGVMEFTHINVSKYNYCYSDHSFPETTTDYPHHTEMYNYIKSYADKHELFKEIEFKTLVLKLEELLPEQMEKLQIKKPTFQKIKFYDKLWKITTKNLLDGTETIYVTPYVSISSGHHGTPTYASFQGQETFPGEIIHSVKFKSARFNNMVDKRVLIVGIGNSAVDAAVNLVNEGRCSKVVISTRSGAWIIPNYISGYATDLYACRTLLSLPWKLTTNIMEATIKFIYGDPKAYNLNPKMRAFQTQPTVSPTLIHHLQRKHIIIKPNIRKINGSMVSFENGDEEEFDSIILCTGYKIDLNYLSDDIKKQVFVDKEETMLNLFKQVFHPKIGKSLGFLGFIQPTSGGLLTVSEMQARWHTSLMLNQVKLPLENEMSELIKKDQEKTLSRFFNSKRHTIQQDPIKYNDEIGDYIGTKPSFYQNIMLSWRLLFSSCGPAQWRLNGPDSSEEAPEIIRKVPVTDMMKFFSFILFLFLLFLIFQIIRHPMIFSFLGISYIFYRSFYNQQKE